MTYNVLGGTLNLAQSILLPVYLYEMYALSTARSLSAGLFSYH